MIVEWELVSHCNYSCEYCVLPDFKYVKDLDQIAFFINNVLLPYREVKLFCFGGEPFLHKHISKIIQMFNDVKQSFVIQSNLSRLSIDIIENCNLKNFELNGSIHPSQVSIVDCITDIERLILLSKTNNIKLNIMDIMYSGKKAIMYYKILHNKFPNMFRVIPISGFYETASCELTGEYNKLRGTSSINMEEIIVSEYNEYRSMVWQKQCEGTIVTKDKPCKYSNEYILFDSLLNNNNCCYREVNDGICKHDKCFWM